MEALCGRNDGFLSQLVVLQASKMERVHEGDGDRAYQVMSCVEAAAQ
jgi:hypothetical protein